METLIELKDQDDFIQSLAISRNQEPLPKTGDVLYCYNSDSARHDDGRLRHGSCQT